MFGRRVCFSDKNKPKKNKRNFQRRRYFQQSSPQCFFIIYIYMYTQLYQSTDVRKKNGLEYLPLKVVLASNPCDFNRRVRTMILLLEKKTTWDILIPISHLLNIRALTFHPVIQPACVLGQCFITENYNELQKSFRN